MSEQLYGPLASWWPVLSDPADYAEEARLYREALDEAAAAPIETLLELGSGGGNNASHLKEAYRLTLVDRSEGMLAVSRELNPQCSHQVGDMRTLRLGESFDAVLIHDAIMYLTSEADLQLALQTAFAHCRPGGVALFVPDDTQETWQPSTSHGGHDRGERSLRYLEWSYDPDPADSQVTSAYAFLLREGAAPPRVVQDLHTLGLFPRSTWLQAIAAAGFDPVALPYQHSSFPADAHREMFLGTRR